MRTGIALFYFEKVSFMKHLCAHVYTPQSNLVCLNFQSKCCADIVIAYFCFEVTFDSPLSKVGLWGAVIVLGERVMPLWPLFID